MRRGTAYFARNLNELADPDLGEASLVRNWTRRRLVAEVSLHARALAIALKELREELSDEEAAWRPDPEFAATLPPHALRYLYHHSAIHLNVEFRDLLEKNWDKQIAPNSKARVYVRTLPLQRAQLIWVAARNLLAEVKVSDLPEHMRRLSELKF
ncbi:MAG: maleylpyruvate isomerase N-terminal domain-containing protein [Roseibium sp.]|uniref:maleylpyruvate isomerase N-terminal domain-containing protein n=1 Tax=Roseibium sp. TaxID=1936156 RepID=UPI003D9C4BA8